jgi:hypothetical protein
LAQEAQTRLGTYVTKTFDAEVVQAFVPPPIQPDPPTLLNLAGNDQVTAVLVQEDFRPDTSPVRGLLKT